MKWRKFDLSIIIENTNLNYQLPPRSTRGMSCKCYDPEFES